MSGSNLPDDVTPADIDAHYAEPDDTLVSGAVDVGVDVRVFAARPVVAGKV